MSRDNKTTSLGELMGKQADRLTLDNLPEILGEAMPEMPRNALGRNRLMNALKQRFGAGFRNLPGVKDLFTEFDKEVNLKRIIAQNRSR